MYSLKLETTEATILCYPSMQPAGIVVVLSSPKSREAKMGKLTTQSSISQTQNYMCNDTRNASRQTENLKRQRN